MGGTDSQSAATRAQDIRGDEQSLSGQSGGECVAARQYSEGKESEGAGAAAAALSGVGKDCQRNGGSTDVVSDGSDGEAENDERKDWLNNSEMEYAQIK